MCVASGYSDLYVPFCGLATIEQLSGIRTGVVDPCLAEVQQYGYQSLQPHQDEVICKAQAVVGRLRGRINTAAAARGAEG